MIIDRQQASRQDDDRPDARSVRSDSQEIAPGKAPAVATPDRAESIILPQIGSLTPPIGGSARVTAAWALANNLWPVPITPIDSDRTPNPGKAPIGREWGKTRRNDRYFYGIYKHNPTAGIGLKLGAEGGIIDIDVDDPEHADETLRRLFPDGIPPTLGWSSGKGPHYLFRYDPRLAKFPPIIKGVRRDGKTVGNPHYLGIEIRIGAHAGDGKQYQTVIPPSRKSDGKPREWNGDREILALPESVFADLERYASERVKEGRRGATPARSRPQAEAGDSVARYAATALERECLAVANSTEGGRNDQLNRSAFALGQLVGAGALSRRDAEMGLSDAARKAGLGEAETAETIRSGLESGMAEPRDLSHVGERAPRRNRGTVGGEDRHARWEAIGRAEADKWAKAKAESLRQGGRLIPTEGIIEDPDDPHLIARTYVRECYDHPDHPTIVYHLGDFHEFRDGCHQAVPPGAAADDLTAGIKRHFDRLCLEQMEEYEEELARYEKAKAKDPNAGLTKPSPPPPPTPLKVKSSIFNDTMRALRSMISVPHTLPVPCWLRPIAGAPDPNHILPTCDGLVDLSSLMIEEDGAIDLRKIKVYDPTPAFFSPYVLGFRFDPDAPEPNRFLRFVDEIFPNDPESQRELQKWFGYLISPDTSQQAMLYLIGKPRSGKGTIGRVLVELLGKNNIVSPALMDLAETFGLSDCLGKTLMLISDARIAGDDKDLARLQERLLKISGEDLVRINRKQRDMLNVKLMTRIVIISNEVPGFRDSSGAFKARMRPLRFLQSFEGCEDRDLDKKLAAEMPGILNWAIAGKALLRCDGAFHIPDSAAGIVRTLAESATPMHLFLSECCITTDPDAREKKDELYLAYNWWCSRNGCPPKSKPAFGRLLMAARPEIDEIRLREPNPNGGEDLRPWGYCGIRLQPEVADRVREKQRVVGYSIAREF